MPQFLYLYETETPRAALRSDEAAALSPVLTAVQCVAANDPDNVPGESTGVLVREDIDARYFPPQRFAVDLSRQEWRRWAKLDNGLSIWCGMWNDWVPTPEDLRRSGPEFRGQCLELEDGNRWQLPQLMHVATGESLLPYAFEYNDTGEGVRRPLRKYRELCRQAESLWDMLMALLNRRNGGDPSECVDLQLVLRVATESLRLNYRVSNAEVSLLQLFSDANWLRVLGALVGVETFEDLRRESKKNGAGVGATVTGTCGAVA